ncbi:hypothetical protein CLAIMM_00110 [Cladophialophora immunda]|nr:hypothetical protein CLAIMM_00110 [Cladophialophora immunda]
MSLKKFFVKFGNGFLPLIFSGWNALIFHICASCGGLDYPCVSPFKIRVGEWGGRKSLKTFRVNLQSVSSDKSSFLGIPQPLGHLGAYVQASRTSNAEQRFLPTRPCSLILRLFFALNLIKLAATGVIPEAVCKGEKDSAREYFTCIPDARRTQSGRSRKSEHSNMGRKNTTGARLYSGLARASLCPRKTKRQCFGEQIFRTESTERLLIQPGARDGIACPRTLGPTQEKATTTVTASTTATTATREKPRKFRYPPISDVTATAFAYICW